MNHDRIVVIFERHRLWDDMKVSNDPIQDETDICDKEKRF